MRWERSPANSLPYSPYADFSGGSDRYDACMVRQARRDVGKRLVARQIHLFHFQRFHKAFSLGIVIGIFLAHSWNPSARIRSMSGDNASWPDPVPQPLLGCAFRLQANSNPVCGSRQTPAPIAHNLVFRHYRESPSCCEASRISKALPPRLPTA